MSNMQHPARSWYPPAHLCHCKCSSNQLSPIKWSYFWRLWCWNLPIMSSTAAFLAFLKRGLLWHKIQVNILPWVTVWPNFDNKLKNSTLKLCANPQDRGISVWWVPVDQWLRDMLPMHWQHVSGLGPKNRFQPFFLVLLGVYEYFVDEWDHEHHSGNLWWGLGQCFLMQNRPQQ